MWPAREVELKLEVPADSLYRLARSPLLRAARKKSPKPTTLVSVYFDTDKLKLRHKGLSLRVRRIGRRHIQTIKQESGESAAVFTRDEWEHQIGGRQPDLDVAQDAALGPVFGKKVRRSLKPIFETRVRRTVYPSKVETARSSSPSTRERSKRVASLRPFARWNWSSSGANLLSFSNSRACLPKKCQFSLRSRARPSAATRSSPASRPNR